MDTSGDNVRFEDDIRKWCEESFRKTGGPSQYLHTRYSTETMRMEFATALFSALPPLDTVTYHWEKTLPAVQEDRLGSVPALVLHPAVFAFGPNVAVKSQPETHVALRLLDEYLVDGFLTAAEPLRVTLVDDFPVQGDGPWVVVPPGPSSVVVPPEPSSVVVHPGPPGPALRTKLLPQSVGYTKGHARMCTLLSIFSYCLDHGLDLKTVHSELYRSALRIHAHYVPYRTKRDALFANFQMSSRGSIRKPPHSLTWVAALRKLNVGGDRDAGAIVRAWNATVSRASALTGAKSMSVRLVLEQMPDEAYAVLVAHVSACGWDACAVSDDALGSKKIYPGWTFRHTTKEWTQRGVVTPPSTVLMMNYMVRSFERTPTQVRKKPDRGQWEEAANVCAALESFLSEIKAIAPVPDSRITEGLVQPFLNGEPQLELELNQAVHEKNPKFVVRDITAIATLLDGHAREAPIIPASSMNSEMTAIEENAFDLMRRQVEYDIQVFKVWLQKVRNVEHHIFHQRLEAQRRVHIACRAAAEIYMATNMTFTELDKPDRVLREIAALTQTLSRKHRVPNEDQESAQGVVTVVILNWIAPSTLSAASMEAQATMASCLVHTSDLNIGILLSPMFSYKKGQLWTSEQAAVNQVARKGLVVDRSWSLLFSERRDVRDSRPLQYRGRVMEPPGSEAKSVWHDTKIFRGYTDPANQLSARDMVVVEDTSETALPGSVDDGAVTVQGAKKFEQIGTDASTKVLLAVLEGVDLPPRTPILLIDLNASVGHFIDGFVEARLAVNRPLYYVAVHDDAMALSWLQQTKLDMVCDMVQRKAITVPGHTIPAENLVALLESRPPRPDLNLLVFGPDDKDNIPTSLRMPQPLVQQWMEHPDSSRRERFNSFLEEAGTWGVALEVGGCALTTEPSNKRSAADSSTEGAFKKAKLTDPAHLTPVDPQGPAPFLEVPLVSVKHSGKVSLCIHAGNKMSLVNDADDQLVVTAGTTFAGFGTGKWQVKTGESDREKQLLYQLGGYEDVVLSNGQLCTLLEVVNARRKTHPDCKVSYHDIVPLASGPPGAFGLERTNDIMFVPKAGDLPEGGAGGTHLQTRVGALCPVSAWEGHYSRVVWVVKWGQTGLSPIRPQVVVTVDRLVIPGRHALQLN